MSFFSHSVPQETPSRCNRKHIHFATTQSRPRPCAEVFIELDVERCLEDGIKLYRTPKGDIVTEGQRGKIAWRYLRVVGQQYQPEEDKENVRRERVGRLESERGTKKREVSRTKERKKVECDQAKRKRSQQVVKSEPAEQSEQEKGKEDQQRAQQQVKTEEDQSWEIGEMLF